MEKMGSMKKITDTLRYNYQAVILFFAIIGFWQFIVYALKIPFFLLPPPSSIFNALVEKLADGFLLYHAQVTLYETISGFFIGTILGIGLALLVDRSRFLNHLLHPYIVAFQAMPKMALAPLIVVWFGFGLSSKIAMATFISFFPIFVNSLAGLESLSVKIQDLMHSISATGTQIFIKAKLPNALPYIFAGLETGILLSLLGSVVGEFVGANEGLGYLILLWNTKLDTQYGFAALAMMVVIGIFLYLTLNTVRRRVLFWSEKI